MHNQEPGIIPITFNMSREVNEITDSNLMEQKINYQRRLIQVLDVVDREINFENKRLKEENDSLHHFRVENEDLRRVIEQLNQQVSFPHSSLTLSDSMSILSGKVEADRSNLEFLANKDLRLELEIIDLYTRIDTLLIENRRINSSLEESSRTLEKFNLRVKDSITSVVNELFCSNCDANKEKIIEKTLLSLQIS